MDFHGLKEQFTPFYRTQTDTEFLDERSRKRANSCFFLLAISALLVSLVMVVMGALHAAPINADRDIAGVVMMNCTVLEYCGCPGEPMIPWYLILGGCLTILLLCGRVLLIRCCANKSVTTLIYDLLALVVTSLWLVAGTKFVMALHERKNHTTHNPNQDVSSLVSNNLFLMKIFRHVIGVCIGLHSLLSSVAGSSSLWHFFVVFSAGFVAVSGILFVVMKEKKNVGKATTDTPVCIF